MRKWQLWDKVDALAKRNEELIEALMRKSAELSEAREELKELKNIIDIYLDQEGHNKCWVREVWLRQRVKKPDGSPYPEPEKVVLAEFLMGCLHYAPSQFQELSENEQKMIQELLEVVRKYHYA